jgi:hypothetical protein
MGKPYSDDLRTRVVGAGWHDDSGNCGATWREYQRYRRLHRQTGSVSPAKFGGYKGYAPAAHENLVRQVVAEQPELAELKAVLATEKVKVGRSSISRFLHHLNLRLKKTYGPRSRTGRTSPPYVRCCKSSMMRWIAVLSVI